GRGGAHRRVARAGRHDRRAAGLRQRPDLWCGQTVSRPSPRRSVLTPPRRKLLGDDVADRLREAILHGELLAGQHLREEELAERLQVSRGPVRDAFVVLEREGLIRSSRHRGVQVVELTLDDLHEIYTLRSARDPRAVSLAIERGTESDLAEIEAALAEFTAALSPRMSERTAADLD